MIKVTIEISDEDIGSIFTTAIEQGAIGYWCDAVPILRDDGEAVGDACVRILNEGKEIPFVEQDETDAVWLSKDGLIDGFQAYFETWDTPSLYAGDWDAYVADFIIQFALFGECRYS